MQGSPMQGNRMQGSPCRVINGPGADAHNLKDEQDTDRREYAADELQGASRVVRVASADMHDTRPAERLRVPKKAHRRSVPGPVSPAASRSHLTDSWRLAAGSNRCGRGSRFSNRPCSPASGTGVGVHAQMDSVEAVSSVTRANRG